MLLNFLKSLEGLNLTKSDIILTKNYLFIFNKSITVIESILRYTYNLL